jgi:hypothetical protein
MRNGKPKSPNATKHGAFAGTAILPGEDPAEFEELHLELVAEWKPEGATEKDAVLSIAKAVWRKRRVQRFLSAQVLINRANPRHQLYNEVVALIGFAGLVRTDPETAISMLEISLNPSRVKYFKEKFARSKFGSTEEWGNAVFREIASIVADLEADPHSAQAVAMYQSAEALSGDLFKQELALDERLDAMIDRAVKRLIQTKAMKQMLEQVPSNKERGLSQKSLK